MDSYLCTLYFLEGNATYCIHYREIVNEEQNFWSILLGLIIDMFKCIENTMNGYLLIIQFVIVHGSSNCISAFKKSNETQER